MRVSHIHIALTVTFNLLVIISSFAQESTKAANDNKYKALLWKIEGNGLKKPSYLFGTVHMICKDKFILSDKVKSAIDQTEQTYLEMDMDDPSMMDQMQRFMQQETPITNSLTKTDSTFADSLLKSELGVGFEQLNHIKPVIIFALLTQKKFDCPLVSFENEIMSITQIQKKEIFGLSSIEEQYSFLDKVSDIKEFIPSLRQMKEVDATKILMEILDAYLKEDLTSIDKIMTNFSSTNPEIYHQLLTVRNQLWVEKIPSIIQEKPTFIGVGCGHLAGTTGMIELLTNKGFHVTAVH